MRYLLTALLSLLPISVRANTVLMEGIASTNYTILVDTNADKVSVHNFEASQESTFTAKAYYSDEAVFHGLSGVNGRITSSPLGSPTDVLDFSWNGHSQSNRDNTSSAGSHFRMGYDGAMYWGNDRYNGMYLTPGSDEGGHLSIGFGNSSPYENLLDSVFSITARKGVKAGYNNSGNTLSATSLFNAEDSTGRAGVFLGYTGTGGHGFEIYPDGASYLNIYDDGPYGSSAWNGYVARFSKDNAVFSGSVTASSFWGDGSGLTGVGGGGEGNTYTSTKTFTTVVAFTTNTAIIIPYGSTIQRPDPPVDGSFRFNTTDLVGEIYYGGSWYSLGGSVAPTCTGAGGTISIVSGYCIHTFSTSGTFTAPGSTSTAEILVVAGGGGGKNDGGGGGGGGVLHFYNNPITGSDSITIGAGGAAGTNGSNSVFGSSIAFGGGHGGQSGNGADGGSGGAGGNNGAATTYGGLGYVGQGHDGGGNGGYMGSPYPEGGGGGAGAIGGDATGNGLPGLGGNGLQVGTSGANAYYGGGGGGYCDSSGGCTGAAGGLGGGATGSLVGTDGTDGLGGGGSGAGSSSFGGVGGHGGSGVVVIRYPVQ